jgi:hypothetical protein
MRTTLTIVVAVLGTGLMGLHAYALYELAGLLITLCVYGFVFGTYALNSYLMYRDMRAIERHVQRTHPHLYIVR